MTGIPSPSRRHPAQHLIAQAIAGAPIPRDVAERDAHWDAVEEALAAEREREEAGRQ
jgi:hypothetical protein